MDIDQGLVADPLFVAMTRPAMVWGVTYSAMLLNVVVTMETFIVTKNLLWLFAFVPIHGLFSLICVVEPRFFDLLQVWGRTRFGALASGTLRFWKANSYTPLAIDLPDARGRRHQPPSPVVA